MKDMNFDTLEKFSISFGGILYFLNIIVNYFRMKYLNLDIVLIFAPYENLAKCMNFVGMENF